MTEVKEKLRLNLGARDRAIPGFKSMDCEQHPGVDIVGNVSDLSFIKDGEAVEIYASHILEHFPHVDTLNVLKEWARVLEPGGKLYVGVPDFKRAVDIYQDTGLRDWIQNWLCGDQVYPTAFHYAIFDEGRLSDLLVKAGFSKVERVVYFPIGDKNDCSRNVSSVDLMPVSLNMIATK
jgi:predicted SAM-dependent methyltransferase